MKTRITPDNPHGYSRHGFAWQNVPQGGAAHLDFGCYDGTFLATLKSKGIGRLVGVDVSQDAIRKARERFGDLEIIQTSQTAALPFEDSLFASITALEVIEHLSEQRIWLDELNRVLKDDGTLIVTVPGQHIFSFLDTGNLKFRFPRLHRWYYRRTHSESEYEQRYVSNPDGLVGDISAEKRWHEHFTRAKLEKLLNKSGFEVVAFDGSGFFSRIIKGARFLCGWLKPLEALLRKMAVFDARFFKSSNLYCVARKQLRTQAKPSRKREI